MIHKPLPPHHDGDIPAWENALQSLDFAQVVKRWESRLRSQPEVTQRAALASMPDLPALTATWESQSKKSAPLAGIPYMLKDLFDLKGVPTRAGSSFLSEVRPLPDEDCALKKRLDAAGAVCVGKTHLNEFALGLTGENIHYGQCPHPLDASRVAGGSSSGSAWAVGAKLVPMAFGTDTVGSIRVPAAYCGIYGFRLPPGPLTRDGCFPLSPSLDTCGWFTTTERDCLALVQHFTGTALGPGITGGYYFQPPGLALDATIAQTYRQAAKERGAVPLPQSQAEKLAPLWEEAPGLFGTIRSYEAWQIHSAWVAQYPHRYEPGTLERLRPGATISATDYQEALKQSAGWIKRFQTLIEPGQPLWTPIAPGPAPRPAQCDASLRRDLVYLNAPASIAGAACLAVPVPWEPPLSLGLQAILPQLPTV